MKTNTSFRVEVNHGSKYFDKGMDAFYYFHKMAFEGHAVEIFLRTTTISRKVFSITEELLDYNLAIQGLVSGQVIYL